MTSWVGRGLALLGLLCASACGDDDAQDNPSSTGKDAGANQGEPSGGKTGGKGGRGGSAASGAGRDGGSGRGGSSSGGTSSAGKGGSSGGNTTSDPGEFDDYWKRRSVHVTVIDATNPTGFTDEMIELPDRIKNPVDGRELDLYIQIKDDKRYTYALFEGDQVYYRMVTDLVKADDTYFDSSGGETQIYELADGVLKDTRIAAFETTSVSSESLYEKAAQFPPSDWPDAMLDTVEVTP